MKNTSVLKIIVSLLIIGIYTFLFGVLGRVDSLSEDLPAETATSAQTEPPAETSPITEQSGESDLLTAPEEGFSYGTTIDVSNGRKPLAGDYAQAYVTNGRGGFAYEDEPDDSSSASEATSEDTPDFSEPEPPDDTETTESTIETPGTTTTEQTTTTEASTTEAVTEPTTEATTEPTTEATTTEAETEQTTSDNSAAASEQLTVYYTGSGGNVTGNAVDIISQVVMGEIGGNFDPEAIKAQAVAAYTYVKYYNMNNSVPYVAVRTPNQTVINCVEEVIGKAIYYNGSLIQSVYGASTAGYTASSKTVWGVDYPYLQSRYCELDSQYDPNYGLTMRMTADEVKNLVLSTTGISLEGDPSEWFKILNKVDTVFVGDMTIGGKNCCTINGKTVYFTGRTFREKVMNFKLRSASFEIYYDNAGDSFTFTTYGYGHCVGLSQHGANLLATHKGYDYRQILDFYFPGTEIK